MRNIYLNISLHHSLFICLLIYNFDNFIILTISAGPPELPIPKARRFHSTSWQNNTDISGLENVAALTQSQLSTIRGALMRFSLDSLTSFSAVTGGIREAWQVTSHICRSDWGEVRGAYNTLNLQWKMHTHFKVLPMNYIVYLFNLPV